MSRFFKSWKTTLMGLLVGALQAKAGGMTWGSIGIGVGTAVLGGLAKDADVSGTDPK
jgi:hypothetical protein